jgi:hypothetical protein
LLISKTNLIGEKVQLENSKVNIRESTQAGSDTQEVLAFLFELLIELGRVHFDRLNTIPSAMSLDQMPLYLSAEAVAVALPPRASVGFSAFPGDQFFFAVSTDKLEMVVSVENKRSKDQWCVPCVVGAGGVRVS